MTEVVEVNTSTTVIVDDSVVNVVTAGTQGPPGSGTQGPQGPQGPAGSGAVTTITQAAHGLMIQQVVRLSGSTYVLAQADSAANAEVVGIISGVPDGDTLAITTQGRVTGLSGLTAGRVYFLSPSIPGALTATETNVVGEVSKSLLIADSATSGYFFNMRGAIVGNPGGSGSPGSTTPLPFTITRNIDERITEIEMTGGNTYTFGYDGNDLLETVDDGTYLRTFIRDIDGRIESSTIT